jgi:hypothetical protein
MTENFLSQHSLKIIETNIHMLIFQIMLAIGTLQLRTILIQKVRISIAKYSIGVMFTGRDVDIYVPV